MYGYLNVYRSRITGVVRKAHYSYAEQYRLAGAVDSHTPFLAGVRERIKGGLVRFGPQPITYEFLLTNRCRCMVCAVDPCMQCEHFSRKACGGIGKPVIVWNGRV
jgi:hypothetical protein